MSGGQIVNTYEVDNYPGLKGINGFDMGLKFREHADLLGAKHENGEVVSIEDKITHKVVHLTSGDQVVTKTVIIATGARYRKLAVLGEEELIGMGVSYCATCDGAFFKNRVTAVVGGGDVAVEDAIFLARLCKKVYVIHRREEFRSAKILSTRLLSMDNVEVCWNETVSKIVGDDHVTGICIKNVKTQEEKEIEVDGVFIAVGTTPNTSMIEGLVKMNKGGYVVADETCNTSIAGIFAAGDVRTKLLRQVVTAASDGAIAITSVESYLNSEM
jgi:thioredoxin reductase (NADPH)